jgi:hypothetical protein
MKKSLFARIMVLGLALVLVTGCASLRGVTSVDPQNGSQVFQAQAVKLPSGIASLKELDQLTGVVIPLNLNWLSDALIKGVSVGGKQEVILRDVWPALVIAPDGQVTETSALLSQGMDQLYILVPNMSEAQVKKSHVYIVSANHTAVMTLRGAIIGGPIGLREEVDVVRLMSYMTTRQGPRLAVCSSSISVGASQSLLPSPVAIIW